MPINLPVAAAILTVLLQAGCASLGARPGASKPPADGDATKTGEQGRSVGATQLAADRPSVGARDRASGCELVQIQPFPEGFSLGSWRAVNGRGQMAGFVGRGPNRQAAVAQLDGSVRRLGTLPGDTLSAATDINEAGTVVGFSARGSQARAFVWEGHQLVPLPDMSIATALNDSGHIAGVRQRPSPARGVWWDGVTQHELDGGEPKSISPSGLLTGHSKRGIYFYNGSTTTFIGTLGGSNASGKSVNDRGWVTGYSFLPDRKRQEVAVLWDNTQLRPIAPTQPGVHSTGLDISPGGLITGWMRTEGKGTRPFLWKQGRLFDLAEACPTRFCMGWKISDQGKLTGGITDANDDQYLAYWQCPATGLSVAE